MNSTGQYNQFLYGNTGVAQINPQIPQQSPPYSGGFDFQSQIKTEQINWQAIHDLDLDKIKQKNDIDTLESFLPNLMNSTIDEEEFNMLKYETLLKLTEIMQYSLQYFDYTNDYIDGLTHETQDEIYNLEAQIKENEQYLKKSKKQIQKLKEEIAIKKEAIQKYKKFLKQKPALKCHLCANKFFLSEDYLDSHMKRRHPNHLPLSADNPLFNQLQNILILQNQQNEKIQKTVQEKFGQTVQQQSNVQQGTQNSYNQQPEYILQQQALLQQQQQEFFFKKIEDFFKQTQEDNKLLKQKLESKIDSISLTNEQKQIIMDQNYQQQMKILQNQLDRFMTQQEHQKQLQNQQIQEYQKQIKNKSYLNNNQAKKTTNNDSKSNFNSPQYAQNNSPKSEFKSSTNILNRYSTQNQNNNENQSRENREIYFPQNQYDDDEINDNMSENEIEEEKEQMYQKKLQQQKDQQSKKYTSKEYQQIAKNLITPQEEMQQYNRSQNFNSDNSQSQNSKQSQSQHLIQKPDIHKKQSVPLSNKSQKLNKIKEKQEHSEEFDRSFITNPNEELNQNSDNQFYINKEHNKFQSVPIYQTVHGNQKMKYEQGEYFNPMGSGKDDLQESSKIMDSHVLGGIKSSYSTSQKYISGPHKQKTNSQIQQQKQDTEFTSSYIGLNDQKQDRPIWEQSLDFDKMSDNNGANLQVKKESEIDGSNEYQQNKNQPKNLINQLYGTNHSQASETMLY